MYAIARYATLSSWKGYKFLNGIATFVSIDALLFPPACLRCAYAEIQRKLEDSHG